jgi:plasmid stabilization system protein ParE
MENKLRFSSIISTRAQKEVASSWEWYEERAQGLGDRFLEEVTARIKEIEESPTRYSTRYKNYKETNLSTFPFLIVYKVNLKKRSIRIVSVFHTSRSPKKKYN